MLAIDQAIGGAVISAESARLAAIAAALRDRFSRREKDHIKGVRVSTGIQNWPGQVSGADLRQKF